MSTALPRQQSFRNHRAIPPASYLLAGLVLAVESAHRAWLAYLQPGFWSVWAALVGIALIVVWIASRMRARIVQDRVIRLEAKLRLERLLGPERRADVERLGLDELVALRFAGEAEMPALFERVLAGELTGRNPIKRAITDWQADWLRV